MRSLKRLNKGEGRIVAAPQHPPANRRTWTSIFTTSKQASSDMHSSTEQFEGFSVNCFATETAPRHCLAFSLQKVHKWALRSIAMYFPYAVIIEICTTN